MKHLRLLGGLAPRTFLRRHWQKRPLFVRGALPVFRGMQGEARDLRLLASLATRDDVESRIVERRGRQWETLHGPFKSLAYAKRNFSLLVSGVNLHAPAADALLRRFDFLPRARIDDVMVSYATPGGGVGPHVDSYDVFLLQGPGTRRWRVWFEGKVLQYDTQAGDLLYLPPGLKHDGVALDACFTYSIGFRAPRGAELAAAFLDWLHERGLPDARYRDPRLAPTRHPGRVPPSMRAFCRDLLRRIDWKESEVADFLGRYLTEPKAHVVFRASAGRGPMVALDAKTQLLYDGGRFFINGEAFGVEQRAATLLRELADRRCIAAARLAGTPLAGLVSRWLRSGYVRRQKKPD
jgi:50S ribosomal protein L16 3-hydroxylase